MPLFPCSPCLTTWQKMDRNKDGVVTIEEFIESCQKVRLPFSTFPWSKLVRQEKAPLDLFHPPHPQSCSSVTKGILPLPHLRCPRITFLSTANCPHLWFDVSLCL